MDSSKLILTGPVSPPTPLELAESGISKGVARLKSGHSEGLSEEERRQAAKDFESVLIGKLLDAMKETIGDWGFEEDSAAGQVQGIFWLHMARDIANNGGFGIWKEIYQVLANSESTKAPAVSPTNEL